MPTLSIIILSYNRRDALLHTLAQLAADPIGADAEIIVVDNASSDASAQAVRAHFPGVRVLELAHNCAIDGFNQGALLAHADTLLILDDDAWPAPNTLARALEVLESDPTLGGVALVPVHPRTGVCEWPFVRRHCADFPIMGCGNVVRAQAWRRVAGYESRFWLYRNDVDLALKLRSAGSRVVCDPRWIVWHDSHATGHKSERWLTLATRNWVWLVQRHEDNPLVRAAALLLHLLHTLPSVGLSRSRLAALLDGLTQGLAQPPPLPPSCTRPNNFRQYLRLRLGQLRA